MSVREARGRARAKINLILRVLEREPGGYHQIETLFQRLALDDDLSLRTGTASRRLTVRWDGLAERDLGPPEANLAWCAADAYREATGFPETWEISLVKRIPPGAGLGGGSSDAAAVLRALNAIAPRRLDLHELAAIGATLGTDVAFFVHDVPLATGRAHGERITTIAPLPAARVVLAVPPFGVSTKDAYARLAASRAGRSAPSATLSDASTWSTWPDVARHQANDFEATVFAEHPELGEMRARLDQAGATIARLSGTGSVVFGIWPIGGTPAIKAPEGWRLVETRTE